jgi:hypothetical protein
MKVLLITKSCSPLYQLRKYGTLIEWVVVRTGGDINVGMGRFAVYLMAPRAIRSPVNICVQEGKVAVSFGLHGKLNILVDSVQVIKEVPQPILTMGPIDKSIIHVTEPAEDLWALWLNAISWKSSMKKVAVTSKLIANPLVCLQNWPARLKYKEVRTWWKSSRMSSKCRSVRFRASLIKTMVKSDTTLKLTVMFSGPVWRDLNVDHHHTKSAGLFV